MAREKFKKKMRERLASIGYAPTRRGALMAAKERGVMTRQIQKGLPKMRASDLLAVWLIVIELGDQIGSNRARRTE